MALYSIKLFANVAKGNKFGKWIVAFSLIVQYLLLFITIFYYMFCQFPYIRDICWFAAKCLACLALKEFRYRLKWLQVRASATNVSFFFVWKLISSLPRLHWRAGETSCLGRFLGKLWNEFGKQWAKKYLKSKNLWKREPNWVRNGVKTIKKWLIRRLKKVCLTQDWTPNQETWKRKEKSLPKPGIEPGTFRSSV